MTYDSVDSIPDSQLDSTLSSSLPVELQEGCQGLEVEEVCVEACKWLRFSTAGRDIANVIRSVTVSSIVGIPSQ
jgi:hypothetical protein